MTQDYRFRQTGESPAEAVRVAGVEGVEISPAVYGDRSAFVEASRRGLPGTVVKQAVNALGHRELIVRLLGTTAGNLSRFYQRRTLAPVQSEALLDLLRVLKREPSVSSESRRKSTTRVRLPVSFASRTWHRGKPCESHRVSVASHATNWKRW